mmetsp:Transcript_1811/g.2311  ORF Transcript_1811/g.2311 Transcript_1811/m.2311 type:complete len:190 (+) Transcript_1811:94-663(+)
MFLRGGNSSIVCLMMALVAAAMQMNVAEAFIKQKKQYTPLLFFKVPAGTMPECDEMEKIIKSVEKETGVNVERLDIMRSRAAKSLYEKLVEGNLRSPFPLLYHRESLQRVYGLEDKDLVRSWTKGRLLPIENSKEKKVTVIGGDDDAMDDMEDMDMDELEMELDEELSPMQRRGKEAMKRRMEEGRQKK